MRYKQDEDAVIESAQSSIADGITLGSRGLLADAIEAFEKALSTCHSVKRKSAALHFFTAQALGNKGATLGDLDRYADAVECYDAAIAIYIRMAERGAHVDVPSSYAVSGYSRKCSALQTHLRPATRWSLIRWQRLQPRRNKLIQ